LGERLHPAILALAIPILVILFWGLKGMARAMRGEPEDFENWKAELENLRARVEALERANYVSHQPERR
jgi:hypothetical protein